MPNVKGNGATDIKLPRCPVQVVRESNPGRLVVITSFPNDAEVPPKSAKGPEIALPVNKQGTKDPPPVPPVTVST
jgi:hypothetical protein